MGYGISNEGGPTTLQTRFAVELEGFFLNEKKEVMRDEAMFEMWGGVPGGQAGAATPDGDGGSQGREQKGQETVVVR